MKITTLLICLFFTATLSSCVKDKSQNKDSGDFTEINVPASFDWKTTTSVKCDFTSQAHTSMVYLYLPNASDAFASFYVGESMDKVEISLPTTTSTITVKYQKAEGLSAPSNLTIANGVVKYNVPEDSQSIVPATASAALKTKAKSHDKDGVIYIPAAGMGTLMFEDLWPYYGDFDFNDLVVNYRLQVNLQNNNMASQLFGTIRIAAVGGSLPSDLYMQLDNVRGGEIRDCFKYSSENTSTTPDIEHLNQGNSVHTPALFAFKGIRENKNRPVGGKYLNTTRGYEIGTEEMVEFEFYIDFRNSIPISDLDIENLNFFIARPESAATQGTTSLIEVHCGGQEPSVYGKDVYAKLRDESSQTNNSSKYYHSNSNIVWAINVPEVIPHAYESESFILAYPNFVKWAQSGGAEYADWYKNGSARRVNNQ